ncbi:LCP family protein [Kutzneria sp. CA-103260]|uniref:LCP family protein n=1 Tax=Kutzneria sp. CA-103260 TaxID=2802641 RepID=UPI001BAB0DE4|nr:LCP family protein [Kutzneria sp. CA-103260]QUQ65999.1 cell envelope-related function transcriptional attenuator [Kutzneria sp. CA-103260]
MGIRVAVLAGKVVAAGASIAVLASFGVAWGTYRQLQDLGSSSAISGDSPKSKDGAQNILVMGLTTRLDQNGQPLPKEVQDALHAGDGTRGGYNTNTMIVVHVPNDGSKAMAVSVPRDDEVTFVDTPLGQKTGKLKEAYGLAKEQRQEQLYAQGERDQSTLERESREAGRTSTIHNVEHLLNTTIDHFAEISLAGFYDLATQLGGIDVCLNHATSDTNAGANFKQGPQHLDGAQALAFVRQRDNLPNNDLDRTHRQQAFLAAVTTKLKGQGVFGSLGKMQDLLTVAAKDVVMDKDWDLLSFAQQASALTGGNIEFHTLPIKSYSKDSDGSDINVIDVPYVQAVVRTLFNPPAATSSAPAPTTTSAPPAIKGQGSTVDIRNAGAPDGTAKKLSAALATVGFTAGETTGTANQATTVVYYGSAAKEDATTLAALLGNAKLVPSSAAAAHHVALYLGSDFTWPTALPGGTTAPPLSSVAVPTEGPQGGAVTGGGIPCVD